VDFSNDALRAAEQGLNRLMKGVSLLPGLKSSPQSTVDVITLRDKSYEAIGDDLNSPVVLGYLFEAVRIINSVNDGKAQINENDLDLLKSFMQTFVFEIMGLVSEEQSSSLDHELLDKVVKILLQQRQDAKNRKDFAASDVIRNQLAALGIIIKDTKEGATWERE
jgi:cysteinyl-tRNA synthetase